MQSGWCLKRSLGVLLLKSQRRNARAAALGAVCLLCGRGALLGGLAAPLRAALMRRRRRVLAAAARAGRRRLLRRALLHGDAALQRAIVLGVCRMPHSRQRCSRGAPPSHYVKTRKGCGSSCLGSCTEVYGRRALQVVRLATLFHPGYLWISMDGSPLRSASPLWPPAAPSICSRHSDKRRDIARAVGGACRFSQCIWYHAYL